MTTVNEAIKKFLDGGYDKDLAALYGSAEVANQRKR